MKKLFSVFVVIMLILSMSIPVMADTLNEKNQELNDVNSNIDDTKNELNGVTKEQDQVKEELNQIESKLSQKQSELDQAQSNLEATEDEISQVTEELDVAEDQLSQAEDELVQVKADLQEAMDKCETQEKLNAERIRVMYMNSNTSYLELLFESTSFNDLIDRISMIKSMLSYDQETLDNLLENQEEVESKKLSVEEKKTQIEEQKNEIEDKKASLESKKQEIVVMKNEIITQKNSIEVAQNEKEDLLSKLSEEEANLVKELDQLEAESKQLEKLIKQLQTPPEPPKTSDTSSRGNSYSGGKLAWPVPYTHNITSYYGMRIHPITGKKKLHSGIDISASGIGGKPAIAVADGTVIIAAYGVSGSGYGGYGNVVVIDYGNGLSTLYAHGSNILVSVGQKVNKGDPVLTIGSTGISTGNHLHFEVRENGVPVNPLGYLK